LPQQFLKIEEAPSEKVSIDDIKKAPEEIISKSIFDLSDRSHLADDDRRNFINAHGQIK